MRAAERFSMWVRILIGLISRCAFRRIRNLNGLSIFGEFTIHQIRYGGFDLSSCSATPS